MRKLEGSGQVHKSDRRDGNQSFCRAAVCRGRPVICNRLEVFRAWAELLVCVLGRTISRGGEAIHPL